MKFRLNYSVKGMLTMLPMFHNVVADDKEQAEKKAQEELEREYGKDMVTLHTCDQERPRN